MACRCCRLAAEFPSRVDEPLQHILVLENEHDAEPLDAQAEAGLNLQHLHVRLIARPVVDCQATARTPAEHQNLHAKIAENSVPGRRLDCVSGTGLRLVKRGQHLGRGGADLGPFLLHIGLRRCQGDQGHDEESGNHRGNAHRKDTRGCACAADQRTEPTDARRRIVRARTHRGRALLQNDRFPGPGALWDFGPRLQSNLRCARL